MHHTHCPLDRCTIFDPSTDMDVARAVLPILQRRETALVEQVEALAGAAEVLLSDFDGGVFGEVMTDPNVEELRFCLRRLRSILPTQGDN
jgi:hypothetical protein